MNMSRLKVLLSLLASLTIVCGCRQLKIEADRHGEYFYLTKNYYSSYVDFSLHGKQLMHENCLFSLFPGLPLYLVEKWIVCPLIDVCLLPSDWRRNVDYEDEEYVREHGFYVQVMDVFGRPVPGVEVRAGTWNQNGMPVVYKGHRQKAFYARGLTDEKGELFIPVDPATVEELRKYVSTAGACEKGQFRACWYVPGNVHPPFRKSYFAGEGLVVPGFCSQLSEKDFENPDLLFPQRDPEHVRRIVLEPELAWPDGKTAQWSFIPEKSDKIVRVHARSWSTADDGKYDDLTDMEESVPVNVQQTAK